MIFFSWLLYGDINYNEENSESPYLWGWGDGDGFCGIFDESFSEVASSARFVGPPNGFKYSTLNLYQYDGYSGTEEYFDKDATFLDNDNFGRSVIVTGCDPWTLYK